MVDCLMRELNWFVDMNMGGRGGQTTNLTPPTWKWQWWNGENLTLHSRRAFYQLHLCEVLSLSLG